MLKVLVQHNTGWIGGVVEGHLYGPLDLFVLLGRCGEGAFAHLLHRHIARLIDGGDGGWACAPGHRVHGGHRLQRVPQRQRLVQIVLKRLPQLHRSGHRGVHHRQRQHPALAVGQLRRDLRRPCRQSSNETIVIHGSNLGLVGRILFDRGIFHPDLQFFAHVDVSLHTIGEKNLLYGAFRNSIKVFTQNNDRVCYMIGTIPDFFHNIVSTIIHPLFCIFLIPCRRAFQCLDQVWAF